jgi:hypothetical protein
MLRHIVALALVAAASAFAPAGTPSTVLLLPPCPVPLSCRSCSAGDAAASEELHPRGRGRAGSHKLCEEASKRMRRRRQKGTLWQATLLSSAQGTAPQAGAAADASAADRRHKNCVTWVLKDEIAESGREQDKESIKVIFCSQGSILSRATAEFCKFVQLNSSVAPLRKSR